MRRFFSDAKGNVAILFALATLPVIGGMGAALDYSMANASRADIQKALDSTALALTRMMPTTQANLDLKGMQFFKASLSSNLALSNLSLVITPGVGTLNLEAKGFYTPKLAGIVGIDTFPVGARTQTKWGAGKVEVALVLDNSGSMDGSSRMVHLKAAAADLLTVLKNSAREPEDAKVAIAPFDARVNVGKANKDASWLRWDLWEADNGSCNKSGYTTQSTCVAQKVCTKSQYTSQSSCQNNNGSWVNATWTPANRNTWEGCVEDRDKSNDVLDVAPTSSATRFPTSQCQHGLTYPGLVREMQTLSNNWATLGSTITAMQPAGYTNIAIGLVWGWHLLSPTEVATQGKAYNTVNLTKYIILMTDGDNTKNRFEDSTSTINSRVSTVCTNIKNAGIKTYTIRLVSGNAALLEGCATNKSMYYDVQNAAQLSGVFSAIGTEIANLHLAK